MSLKAVKIVQKMAFSYKRTFPFWYINLNGFGTASGRAGAAHKENLRLRRELEQLEEENNMLRLKFEILLDMMTDKTVEAEQQAEMQRAQSLGSLKHKSKKKWWDSVKTKTVCNNDYLFVYLIKEVETDSFICKYML